MKSFISIISVETNSFTHENVVVGLIAVSGNQVYFDFSPNKLNLVSKFNEQKELSVLSSNSLKKIQEYVKKENSKLVQYKLPVSSLFSAEYFNYLKSYSAGALKFSEPVVIPKTFTNEIFEDYYFKFIGEKPTKKGQHKTTFKSSIKKFITKEGLDKKADIGFKFNPLSFKGILKETSIPLISGNGTIASVQVIDFTSQQGIIVNHVYETQMIHEGLSNFCQGIKKKMDKIKIVCEEPDLNTPQHAIFDMIHKEKSLFFDLINPSELDAYTDMILNSKSHHKFSELL